MAARGEMLAMQIKTILFDWGGVISSSGTPDELFNRLAKNIGIEQKVLRAALRTHTDPYKRGKITIDQFWGGLERDLARTIPEAQRNVWTKVEDLEPDAEIKEFVEKLKSDGYTVAILSNTFPNTAADIKAKGWYDSFFPVILSSDIGMAKPDIEIYEHALFVLGNEPHEVVFVDDQQRCLSPAAVLGMKTVLGSNTRQIINDVSRILEEV